MRLISCVALVTSAMLSACFVDRARYVSGNSEAGPMTDGALDEEGGAMAADAADGSAQPDVADSMVPVRAPRLISPLSSTNVSARVFKVNVEFDGTFYIQLNRNPMFNGESGGSAMNRGTGVIETAFTIGPAVSNPRGTWFMRACAGVGTAACSATWTINVLNNTMTPVNESGFGVAADITGTPSGDVLVTARTPADSHLSRSFIYSTLATTMAPAVAASFDECSQVHMLAADRCSMFNDGLLLGRFGAVLGDATGDGRADIGLYGEQGAATNVGTIAFLAGGTTPSYLGRIDANATVRFLGGVTSAGDFNGDGLADLAVVVQNAAGRRADVFLATRGAVPYALDRRVVLTVPSTGTIPTPARLTGIGDINGDGYADVAMRGKSTDNGLGELWVYLGNADPLSNAPRLLRITGGTRMDFAASIAGAGDANGDGRADVFVGFGPSAGAMSLALASVGTTGEMIITDLLTSVATPGGTSLRAVIAAGDVSGDGLVDAVLVDDETAAATIVTVVRGAGSVGAFSLAAGVISALGSDRFLPRLVVRDVNDDGRGDIIVPLRINGVGDDGPIRAYGLSPMSIEPQLIATMINPDSSAVRFGIDVF